MFTKDRKLSVDDIRYKVSLSKAAEAAPLAVSTATASDDCCLQTLLPPPRPSELSLRSMDSNEESLTTAAGTRRYSRGSTSRIQSPNPQYPSPSMSFFVPSSPVLTAMTMSPYYQPQQQLHTPPQLYHQPVHGPWQQQSMPFFPDPAYSVSHHGQMMPKPILMTQQQQPLQQQAMYGYVHSSPQHQGGYTLPRGNGSDQSRR